MQQGEKTLRLYGHDVPVRAQIESLRGLSAHGDQADLMAWLAGAIARREGGPRTFIVHGESQAAATLAGKIRQDLGWNEVTVPAEGTIYEL